MMPPPKTRRFRSILCAVDLTAGSARALRYADALSQSCGGQLTVIRAVDASGNAAPARKDLAPFVEVTLGPDAAARVRCVTAAGEAGSVVMAYARRIRAQVVVVGSTARRGAGDWLPATMTDAAMRRFRGALLVVPPRGPVAGQCWPGPSVVAIVDADRHRAAGIESAALMAETFGAWLTLSSSLATRTRPRSRHVQLFLLPLPRGGWARAFRQGSDALRFIANAPAPVLVFRTTTRRRSAVPASRRVA